VEKRTAHNGLKAGALKSVPVFFVALFLAACSHKTMSLFFDLPPRAQEEQAVQEDTDSPEAGLPDPSGAAAAQPVGESLPIEAEETWEGALAMLPKTATGQADWVAAQREGIIRPRGFDPTTPGEEAFGLDFFLKSANPMFDAWFPHSAHTDLLSCKNCHGEVFRYRDNEITMAKINQGEFCGACHGKIGFPATACKRCHLSMP
jgi:c(7)-type cytochrome triheme protein